MRQRVRAWPRGMRPRNEGRRLRTRRLASGWAPARSSIDAATATIVGSAFGPVAPMADSSSMARPVSPTRKSDTARAKAGRFERGSPGERQGRRGGRLSHLIAQGRGPVLVERVEPCEGLLRVIGERPPLHEGHVSLDRFVRASQVCERVGAPVGRSPVLVHAVLVRPLGEQRVELRERVLEASVVARLPGEQKPGLALHVAVRVAAGQGLEPSLHAVGVAELPCAQGGAEEGVVCEAALRSALIERVVVRDGVRVLALGREGAACQIERPGLHIRVGAVRRDLVELVDGAVAIAQAVDGAPFHETRVAALLGVAHEASREGGEGLLGLRVMAPVVERFGACELVVDR